MSRYLLLLVFMLWKSWDPNHPDPAPMSLENGLFCFLGFYALLVLAMGLWSRALARRVTDDNLHRSLRRFNWTMEAARLMIPIWFGVGVYLLGWAKTVDMALGPVRRLPVELPSIIAGTLPAFLAWMGLWWSQYPADRALREQSLLVQLDQNLPIHSPPGFWTYFSSNLRLQLLFTIIPIVLVVVVRDVIALIVAPFAAIRSHDGMLEIVASIPAAVTILLLSPEILRRVVPTEPLPPGNLRCRLEMICHRSGIEYRQILLWKTNNNVANAFVMGLHRRVRYVLLSDLLLETMTDEQIEGVFAHEAGHIRHRHMLWYVLVIGILLVCGMGPADDFAGLLGRMGMIPGGTAANLTLLGLGLGIFALVFGYISRKFERQADVYAARTIQSHYKAAAASPVASAVTSDVESSIGSFSAVGTLPLVILQSPLNMTLRPAIDHTRTGSTNPDATYVGPYGAAVFTSALRQVAMVNNIPIAARSWCHGSIAKRISYLNDLSRDPLATSQFDRFMGRLYVGLVFAFCAFTTWTVLALFRG